MDIYWEWLQVVQWELKMEVVLAALWVNMMAERKEYL
jgi:hypothetical protein